MSIPDSLVGQLLTGILAATAPTHPILQDTFTGANGTHLPAHTPNIGGPWLTSGQDLVLQGNKARATGGSKLNHVALTAQHIDLSVDFQFGALGNGDFAEVQLFDDGGGGLLLLDIDDSGNINLNVSGSGGNIGFTGLWTQTLTTHTVRVTFDGVVLSAYLDGVTIVTFAVPSWWPVGTQFTLLGHAGGAETLDFDNVLLAPFP